MHPSIAKITLFSYISVVCRLSTVDNSKKLINTEFVLHPILKNSNRVEVCMCSMANTNDCSERSKGKSKNSQQTFCCYNFR